MPSNRVTKRRGNNPLDCCEHRIKQLHGNRTLKEVKVIIDEELGQSVPESRYREKFRELDLKKYRKANKTNVLCINLAQMPRGSKVFLWGEQLPQVEVERIKSRARPNIFEQLGSHRLPSGYVIRSRTPDWIEDYTADIPFLEFEKALVMSSEDPSCRDLVANLGISPQLLQNGGNTLVGGAEYMVERGWNLIPLSFRDIHVLRNTLANNPRALARLAEVLPFPSTCDDVLGGSPINYNTQMANLFSCRQLLFSVTNNFAGIDSSYIQQLSNLFRSVSIRVLNKLFQVTKGPTIRAIAQSLFKASIECDNHTVIDAILSNKATGVDVSNEKIFIDYHVYTPVERASLLHHHDSIVVLMRHGADVDKTHHLRDPPLSYHLSGALECATNEASRLSNETFKLLVNTTRAVSDKVARSLIRSDKESWFLYLTKHHTEKCKWLDEKVSCRYILLEAISYSSEQYTLDIVRTLKNLEVDAELFHEAAEQGYTKLCEKLSSDYVINLYISFGPRLSRSLQSLGKPPTNSSLHECLSPEIAEHQRGEHQHDEHQHNEHQHDEQLVDLSSFQDELNYFRILEELEDACAVPADYGNKERLDELVQVCRGKGQLREYGSCAFRVACKIGDHQWAKDLLDRGACVDNESLKAAVKIGNIHLIDLILDSGISVIPKSIFTLAAEWGDYQVVRALLAGGARPPAEALHIALKQKDEKMADILLDAGAYIHAQEIKDYTSPWIEMKHIASALQITAEINDDQCTKYVLSRGADPNDTKALDIAYRTDRTVFKTILTAYKERYNRRVKGFGSTTLVQAIKGRDLGSVQMLLEHNVDPVGIIVGEYSKWFTPFGYAIENDNTENFSIVKKFLEHQCCLSDAVFGTDWDAKNKLVPQRKPRTSAFLAAIETENSDLVQFLFKRDETILHAPARITSKRTALQHAADIGSINMVKFLHNLGADINEPPYRDGGATALQLAAIRGVGQIVCYLIDHGADINAPGAWENGMTALVGAAAFGRLDIVAILLNKGAGRGEDGCKEFERAIEQAEENGHFPTSYLLKTRLDAQQQGFSQEDVRMEEFIELDFSDEE
ncbi:ankyrin [Xylaria sp. FL1777]|nr:ankyrin [Xylaria sp. FL1777]